MDSIGTPIRLRAGTYDGVKGTYWAWPVDGYYDLHHTTGDYPDGTDCVYEMLPTLESARVEARAVIKHDTLMRRWGAA